LRIAERRQAAEEIRGDDLEGYGVFDVELRQPARGDRERITSAASAPMTTSIIAVKLRA